MPCRNSRGEAKRGEDGVHSRESFVVVGGGEFRGGVALSHESLRFKKIAKNDGEFRGGVAQWKTSSNMKWIEDSAYYQSIEKRSKLLHPLTRTISFRKMEWPQCMGKAGRRKQTWGSKRLYRVATSVLLLIYSTSKETNCIGDDGEVVNGPLESISSDLALDTLAEGLVVSCVGGTLCISSLEGM
ncbi:hypothetical protein F2Q68_00016200 [Brassica cretica]|uniref:Uncharacterized protein n=1 Tax=Brassica cretica TaxID=69181 RepID=A0A8S9H9V0_BRACR|nr:hypothetical protein F2Q68_00016200 [Brassica cretica]